MRASGMLPAPTWVPLARAPGPCARETARGTDAGGPDFIRTRLERLGRLKRCELRERLERPDKDNRFEWLELLEKLKRSWTWGQTVDSWLRSTGGLRGLSCPKGLRSWPGRRGLIRMRDLKGLSCSGGLRGWRRRRGLVELRGFSCLSRSRGSRGWTGRRRLIGSRGLRGLNCLRVDRVERLERLELPPKPFHLSPSYSRTRCTRATQK